MSNPEIHSERLTSSSTAIPPTGSTTFQNSTISWVPSITYMSLFGPVHLQISAMRTIEDFQRSSHLQLFKYCQDLSMSAIKRVRLKRWQEVSIICLQPHWVRQHTRLYLQKPATHPKGPAVLMGTSCCESSFKDMSQRMSNAPFCLTQSQ